VGHAERVAEIEALAHGHRGLFLAGAAYHGAGVPDCMQNALDIAGRLAAQYGMSAALAWNAVREQGTVTERK